MAPTLTLIPAQATKRSTKESSTYSTHNISPRMYLNCGCWLNGRTDFALVSEDEIALCTWKNHNQEAFVTDGGVTVGSDVRGQVLTGVSPVFKAAKINQFLSGSPAIPLAYYRAPGLPPDPFKFTEDGRLLVFIGDCHIHLFKEWICDNFVRNVPEGKDLGGGFYSARKSLAKDFAEFIHHASNRGVAKEDMIQVGDCFEVWEVQGLYEAALTVLHQMMEPRLYYWSDNPVPKYSWLSKDFPYEYLSNPEDYKKLLAEAEEYRKTSGSGQRQRFPNVCQVVLPKYFGVQGVDDASQSWGVPSAIENWKTKVSPQDVIVLLSYEHGFSQYAPPSGEPLSGASAGQDGNPFAYFDGEGNFLGLRNGAVPLRFTERDEVVKRIKEQYVGSDAIPWDKFSPIEGNHDTKWPDHHLKERYDKDASSKAKVEGPRKALSDEHAKLDLQYNGSMHSHLTGPTNSFGPKKQICIEHGHAFDVANNDEGFFHGVLSGYEQTAEWVVGELSDPTSVVAKVKDYVATQGLEVFTRWRAATIFEKNSEIRLVVMGHTHLATLGDLMWGEDVRKLKERGEAKAKEIEALAESLNPVAAAERFYNDAVNQLVNELYRLYAVP